MKIRIFIFLFPFLLAACAPALPEISTQLPQQVLETLSAPVKVGEKDDDLVTSTPGDPFSSTEEVQNVVIDPTPQTNKRIDDPNSYSFPQLLPWDGIRPVYDPQFASAEEAPLQDSELVMGVAFGSEAKAYPVTVLRFREMVNDEIAGWPVLVTW